jgi:putative ATPase
VRKCGEIVQQESNKHIKENREVPVGGTAVTGAGKLKQSGVKIIIHAVGPMWTNGKCGEEDELTQAVRNTFRNAENYGCRSVAIPAISSGIFGFPKRLCAKTLFDTVETFAREVKAKTEDREYLQVVRFTNFDKETYDIFNTEFHRRYFAKETTYRPRKFYL